MRIQELLTESTYHKLPAIKTVFEADWDNEPIKHYTDDEQREIHRSEELPYTSVDSSINKYTTNQGKHWNNFLHRHYRGRSTNTDHSRYANHVISTDAALTKNTLKKDYVLYTGLNESPVLAFELYNQPTDKPLTVHLPAYTSTTTSWRVAVRFAHNYLSSKETDAHYGGKPVEKYDRTRHELLDINGEKIKELPDNPNKRSIDILRIFVPAGTTGGSVRDMSYNSEEFEVLLPRGLNVIISPKPHVMYQFGADIYVWNAKVVGHDPQPVELIKA